MRGCGDGASCSRWPQPRLVCWCPCVLGYAHRLAWTRSAWTGLTAVVSIHFLNKHSFHSHFLGSHFMSCIVKPHAVTMVHCDRVGMHRHPNEVSSHSHHRHHKEASFHAHPNTRHSHQGDLFLWWWLSSSPSFSHCCCGDGSAVVQPCSCCGYVSLVC